MKPPYHIVFCGTPTFAVESLQALIDDPTFAVDLVITQPDKPAGRKKILTPPPVKVVAKQHNVPVLQPEDVNSQFSICHPELVEGLNSPPGEALPVRRAGSAKSGQFPQPDFLITVAYGSLLGDELLQWPRVAPVNVHASLLPRWRGASPIQHALLSGDRETGVTIVHMVRELDAGPILAQAALSIDERATFESLHNRLALLSAKLLVETLKQPLNQKPQDESKVTACRKLSRKDGEVDPTSVTAQEIDRRVRALVPWPGVTCPLGNEVVKLLKTNLKASVDALPLSCANDSLLHIEKLQPPGGKPMSGAAWVRGIRDAPSSQKAPR